MKLEVGVSVDALAALGTQNFWLTTARYNAGGQLPAVIADHRRGLYAVPQLTEQASQTGWTQNGGWTINGDGTATHAPVSGYLAIPVPSLRPGTLYRMRFTVSGYSAGAMQPDVAGALGSTISANGNFDTYITAGGNLASGFNGGFRLFANATFVANISNISLQEVMLGDVGPELVNDANWQMSVNGGTSTATNSPQGTLNLTGDGTNAANGDQSFTTVVGQAYTLVPNASGNNTGILIGTSQGGQQIASVVITTAGVNFFSFVATSTTTWVRCYVVNAVSRTVGNISLRSWTARPTLRSATFADVYSFTASGTASRSYIGSDGTLRNDLAANQPRFTYERGVRQLALNSAATNAIPNPSMSGATASSLPTGWGFGSNPANGIAMSVVGTGTENGVPYIDIRWNGTAGTGGASPQFYPIASAATVVAAQNQYWTSSLYTKLVAGSLNGSNGLWLSTIQRGAAGAYISEGGQQITVDGTMRRGSSPLFQFTNAGAAFAQTYCYLSVSQGNSVDVTIRVYAPQLEQQQFASPTIFNGSGSAVTRTIETCEHSPLVEAILQRSSATVVGRAVHSYAVNDLHVVGFTGTQWSIGTIGQAGNSYNAVSATGTGATGTAATIPFGDVWGSDATGSQVAYRGIISANNANAPISSYNRTNAYLARDSANYSYGDGFYDEEVIYASRLTGALMQTQAAAYA